MKRNQAERIKAMHVMITGGTHGNELTGVYLVKRWQAQPDLLQRPGLKVDTWLSHPQAIAAGRRYLETDLNRCFRPEDLANPALQAVEYQRARELKAQAVGSPIDILFDLHNTTANMGITLILSRAGALEDPLLQQLIHHLFQGPLAPELRVMYMPRAPEDNPYLPALAQRDLTIEVGPQAHGTLRASLFFQVEALVGQILDFLEAYQAGQTAQVSGSWIYYQEWKNLDYPRDAQGELCAMIHPSLQDRDFICLQPGDPLFIGFDAQIYPYTETEPAWPLFINEQAYYEKGVALTLTRQCQLNF